MDKKDFLFFGEKRAFNFSVVVCAGYKIAEMPFSSFGPCFLRVTHCDVFFWCSKPFSKRIRPFFGTFFDEVKNNFEWCQTSVPFKNTFELNIFFGEKKRQKGRLKNRLWIASFLPHNTFLTQRHNGTRSENLFLPDSSSGLKKKFPKSEAPQNRGKRSLNLGTFPGLFPVNEGPFTYRKCIRQSFKKNLKMNENYDGDMAGFFELIYSFQFFCKNLRKAFLSKNFKTPNLGNLLQSFLWLVIDRCLSKIKVACSRCLYDALFFIYSLVSVACSQPNLSDPNEPLFHVQFPSFFATWTRQIGIRNHFIMQLK